jgi:hypothetical protein
MYKQITLNNVKYRIYGTKREGFTVSEVKYNIACRIGFSIADTPYKALMEVLRNQYSSYY